VAPAARRAALRHAQGLAFDDAWQVGAATPVADLVAEVAAGWPTSLALHPAAARDDRGAHTG
jgi:hypothetical protein